MYLWSIPEQEDPFNKSSVWELTSEAMGWLFLRNSSSLAWDYLLGMWVATIPGMARRASLALGSRWGWGSVTFLLVLGWLTLPFASASAVFGRVRCRLCPEWLVFLRWQVYVFSLPEVSGLDLWLEEELFQLSRPKGCWSSAWLCCWTPHCFCEEAFDIQPWGPSWFSALPWCSCSLHLTGLEIAGIWWQHSSPLFGAPCSQLIPAAVKGAKRKKSTPKRTMRSTRRAGFPHILWRWWKLAWVLQVTMLQPREVANWWKRLQFVQLTSSWHSVVNRAPFFYAMLTVHIFQSVELPQPAWSSVSVKHPADSRSHSFL